MADFYLAPYPCTDISESIETQQKLDDDYFFPSSAVINGREESYLHHGSSFPLLKHNSAVERDMRILQ